MGTEGSRQLVETTIDTLNRDHSLTRNRIKHAIASLTIGSASCAVLLVHRDLSRTGNRLLAAAARAHTDFHDLCRSDRDEAVGSGMQPLMETDSERLMQEGIATGVATFDRFLENAQWSRADIPRTFCHQVGSAHRKLMLQSLDLPIQGDFVTYPWLGNTGSVALPITMAIGLQQNPPATPENVALLGIGSGINCLMLGLQCREPRVQSASQPPPQAASR